jgi:hypothetical protein
MVRRSEAPFSDEGRGDGLFVAPQQRFLFEEGYGNLMMERPHDASRPSDWIGGHVPESVSNALVASLRTFDSRLITMVYALMIPIMALVGMVGAEILDNIVFGPISVFHLLVGVAVGAIVGLFSAHVYVQKTVRQRRAVAADVEKVGFSPRGLYALTQSGELFYPWSKIHLERVLKEGACLVEISPSDRSISWSILLITREQTTALLQYPFRPDWNLAPGLIKYYGVSEDNRRLEGSTP